MILKITKLSFLFVCTAFFYGFTLPSADTSSNEDPVKWYTWEEAVAANEKNPKKFMVDIYTTWCPPCKKMTSYTFKDPEVAEYLNKHYYPIKLDAEKDQDINFAGQTFSLMPNVGRRGIHALVVALLEGATANNRISYPSIVYLDENIQRVVVSPGYKDPEMFLTELQFTAEEHYKKNVSFEDFRAARGK